MEKDNGEYRFSQVGHFSRIVYLFFFSGVDHFSHMFLSLNHNVYVYIYISSECLVSYPGHSLVCCILTFDPAKNAIQSDAPEGSDTSVMRGNNAGELGWKCGTRWRSHFRVLHQKRETSELHDSYSRLMTIKHAIPKIEWALNYYITQSRQSKTVGDRTEL